LILDLNILSPKIVINELLFGESLIFENECANIIVDLGLIQANTNMQHRDPDIDYTTSLDKEKVYLLGHSWGTCPGIELAADHPEHLHAYIGVSQVVDDRRGVQVAYDWLIETARERNDRDRLDFLEELGEPPYDHAEYRQLASLVREYGGNFDLEMWRIALIALRAPEYRVIDYFRLLGGMNRGGAPLHDEEEMLHFDYLKAVPALEVPAFFLVGAKDYNTPAELIEEYYETIEAPRKDLIIFEDSAHTPFLKETELFNQTLIEIKEKTY